MSDILSEEDVPQFLYGAISKRAFQGLIESHEALREQLERTRKVSNDFQDWVHDLQKRIEELEGAITFAIATQEGLDIQGNHIFTHTGAQGLGQALSKESEAG